MSSTVIPSYEVEFIPSERRLSDRRVNPNAGLPPGITMDRRKGDRRTDSNSNEKPLTA
jgi:hypothetical protein